MYWRASVSSPHERTTTTEQPTTLTALPSALKRARPAHSPRVLLSSTLISGIESGEKRQGKAVSAVQQRISHRVRSSLSCARVPLTLLAQRGDELGVCRLIARVGEDAQMGLAAVEALDGLVESARESIVEHRRAQNDLQRRHGVKRLRLRDHDLLHLNILNLTGQQGSSRQGRDRKERKEGRTESEQERTTREKEEAHADEQAERASYQHRVPRSPRLGSSVHASASDLRHADSAVRLLSPAPPLLPSVCARRGARAY